MKTVKRTRASKVGKRGTVVIPAKLRKLFGLEEGTLVITEAREEGILLRPAVTLPIRIWSLEETAEFVLNNAISAEDYARAAVWVKSKGLDPDAVEHDKPWRSPPR